MGTTRPRTLLWVEDECQTLNALIFPLHKKGWTIVTCMDLVTAQQRIASEQPYDFYLIDLILPYDCNAPTECIADLGREGKYRGIALIEDVRRAHGPRVPIGVFSVVYDPIIDERLTRLNVGMRFAKGTASNADLCGTILRYVSEPRHLSAEMR